MFIFNYLSAVLEFIHDDDNTPWKMIESVSEQLIDWNMFNQASNEKNELRDTQKLPLFDLPKQKKTFCAKNGSWNHLWTR